MTKTKQRAGESKRLIEDAGRVHDWKRWGAYLSERQWGTVKGASISLSGAWPVATTISCTEIYSRVSLKP